MPIISVTLPSDNTSANVADYNTPITTILSTLNGGLDDDNIASLSGTKITANTLPQSALTDAAKNGWNTGMLPAVSSVTNNGNGSYTMVFASTVAGYLAPKMRLQTTRTVTAPTYMSSTLNGSTQYYTDTSISGTLSTVTNNFTIMGHVRLAAYGAIGNICGRGDSASNNGIWLRHEANGTVSLGVFSGGVANYRYVTTRQSLEVGRKTHVAASWSSGTVVIYFDGISVPVATAVTAGTAPTTAGTGGDWSIGRMGAYNAQYFNGNVSGVGAFNAVLSAATIRSLIPQALTGAESNCIGAWSLDNTPNDQSAAGNNLVAQNSASYTSGLSPYGTDGNGVSAGTTDVGMIMSVSTTTVVVQVPEGCAIPVSGGISAVAYSTGENPYGWVGDPVRWAIRTFVRSDQNTGAVGANVITNLSSLQISVPIGYFNIGYSMRGIVTHAGVSFLTQYTNLSTSASSASDIELFAALPLTNASTSEVDGDMAVNKNVSLAAMTPYYLITQSPVATTTQYFRGTVKPLIIWAIPIGF